ncbi:hypothetical protein AKJ44_02310 [candidate division MSBL1 archaeon SCGC-AAA261F17]|uniref:Uncharacterized protein n=1 Tax=candidate division MSBL1 archaeon SCGC-AAA261F17 TaxID=1698274 RepID=A0A133V5C4_9EURY|nr:hypothetical protein AKJ44_02310 [candidate division MSBL1 archaeon SCGC-AAA261F17]
MVVISGVGVGADSGLGLEVGCGLLEERKIVGRSERSWGWGGIGIERETSRVLAVDEPRTEDRFRWITLGYLLKKQNITSQRAFSR